MHACKLYSLTCTSLLTYCSSLHNQSAMGATISSHTLGTSVSEHGKGKLEFTPQNEALLNDIVKQVEALVSSHPREAETILKEPFKWHSTLKPDNFGELNFGSMGFQITYV